MNHSVPYLHVYGQQEWHDEVLIVGNAAALHILRQAIDAALMNACQPGTKEQYLFAGDGEGFEVKVRLMSSPDIKNMPVPYSAEHAKDHRKDATLATHLDKITSK